MEINKFLRKNMFEKHQEVEKNKDEYKNIRGEIPFITTYFRKIWIAQILDTIPSNGYGHLGEFWMNFTEYATNDEGVKYIVWIYDKDLSEYFEYIDFYDVVYENNAGCILKKKTI